MILQQITGFTLVGAVGAALDWGLFNFFTGQRCGWGRVKASVISTSCAMVWSFSANSFLVFHPGDPAAVVRMLKFLLVTCFSGWVLQSCMVRGTGALVVGRFERVALTLRRIPFARTVSGEAVERNLAKVAAIAAGYVWNFCWYRHWVYAS
jgi:putative flippase GtrA